MAKKKSNNMLLAVGAAVVALFMFGKKKTVHHGMYDGKLPHEDILHDYAEGYEQNVHDMGDRENNDNPFKPTVEPGINTGTNAGSNSGGSSALNTEVNLKPRY